MICGKNAKKIKQNRVRRALQAWTTCAGTMAIASTLCLTACTRSHYRHKADEETFALIREKSECSRDPAVQSIQVDSRSRMFDPFNPDRPPMPEDDQEAHRYMEIIDKKKHYPLWDVNGRTNTAENPCWWEQLPLDERGVLVLDSDTAIRLSILHSPAYQSEVETLYLSALDVSSERFLFDNQFFGGFASDLSTTGPNRAGNGGQSRTNFAVGPFSKGPRSLALQRSFSTGSSLVIGFANSLTWQLSGPNTQTATSLLDFSFLAPLLRRGGRDVILERLTLAERSLLYNVRAFERYRTGFNLQILTGRTAEAGPTRRGGLFGGAGFEGFTGLGGGFGRVGNTANAGQGFANAQAVPRAGGFLGLLQSQLEIRNAEENIARLKDNLLRFEDTLREQLTTVPATQDQIPSQQLQVAQARQALISSQANLLQTRATYEQTLDAFKLTMGLPPYICIEIRDPLLEQFNLISQDLRQRREEVANVRDSIGRENSKLIQLSRTASDTQTGDTYREIALTPEVIEILKNIESKSERIVSMRRTLLDRDVPVLAEDVKRLSTSIGERKAQLSRLKDRFNAEREMFCALLPTGSLDESLFDTTELETLPGELERDLKRLRDRTDSYREKIDKLKKDINELVTNSNQGVPREVFARIRDRAILQSQDILAGFAEDVLALQVLQARARTESILLPEVDLDVRDAVEIARNCRVDWANSRATLVDSWRAIEVVADDLESSLDVVFSGDIQNINDNPLSLRGSTGRLRAGLQFDAPFTRLQERNRYRQSLIEYQQARRQFYQFEDGIWSTLRAELRSLHQNQLNFELQRYAVRIAASQITLNEDIRQVRESLNQASGPTAARDSVSALTDLLSAQNTFQGVWVFYEAQRRNLIQDLGTMQVDGEGIWLDPGPLKLDRSMVEPMEYAPQEMQQLPADLRREMEVSVSANQVPPVTTVLVPNDNTAPRVSP